MEPDALTLPERGRSWRRTQPRRNLDRAVFSIPRPPAADRSRLAGIPLYLEPRHDPLALLECSSLKESESEFAHPFQGQDNIGDVMFRFATERGDRLFNTFRRDRRTPEKDTETVLGLDLKLAIAGWDEHDLIHQTRSPNPKAADPMSNGSVSHRLFGTYAAPSQRRSCVRRARASFALLAKIRPTSTRTTPSRTSMSRSVQPPSLIGTVRSDNDDTLLIRVIATRCPCSGPSNHVGAPVRLESDVRAPPT